METISLDDFYLPYKDRLNLDQKYYPYRGPPGTHDVQMIVDVLQEFKKGNSIKVPKFNKSLHQGLGDREGFRTLQGDILFFEGWMLGYEKKKELSPNLILPNKKPFNMEIGNYFEEKLLEYNKIWKYFDFRIVIKPTDYYLSVQWRLEAEQKMKAQTKSGMKDDQVLDFVSYFWNSLHPEIYECKSDLQIVIDEKRNIMK